jgi:hypothetical protein
MTRKESSISVLPPPSTSKMRSTLPPLTVVWPGELDTNRTVPLMSRSPLAFEFSFAAPASV